MQAVIPLKKDEIENRDSLVFHNRTAFPLVEVALLTGGSDRPYAFGLTMALNAEGIHLEVVGGDAVDGPEMRSTPGIDFFNLRGDQRSDAALHRKISRLVFYYARLIRFAGISKAKIFHILWNNKFMYFDRTLLMLYYRIRGKKIILTAHNVNEARRDGRDSLLNRLTLKVQYRLAEHIFVHTEKMKNELLKDFGTSEQSVTVIPFGINNAVPHTGLTSAEARERLGIGEGAKAILFFGRMRPSKGFEYLLAAFEQIVARNQDYRLIIVGQRNREFDQYWESLRLTIDRLLDCGMVILKDEFIPDEDTELYFKAADVLVLPYTEIFQSGVLFLGYSFGLPVIATDVGSFRADIIEGKTGFLCKPCDSEDLAKTIEKYFKSELFKHLEIQRQKIQNHVETRNSWDIVAEKTSDVYRRLSSEDL